MSITKLTQPNLTGEKVPDIEIAENELPEPNFPITNFSIPNFLMTILPKRNYPVTQLSDTELPYDAKPQIKLPDVPNLPKNILHLYTELPNTKLADMELLNTKL